MSNDGELRLEIGIDTKNPLTARLWHEASHYFELKTNILFSTAKDGVVAAHFDAPSEVPINRSYIQAAMQDVFGPAHLSPNALHHLMLYARFDPSIATELKLPMQQSQGPFSIQVDCGQCWVHMGLRVEFKNYGDAFNEGVTDYRITEFLARVPRFIANVRLYHFLHGACRMLTDHHNVPASLERIRKAAAAHAEAMSYLPF